MNKKIIILCSIVVAVLLAGVVAAVYFLYSDTETPVDLDVTLDDSRYGFFQVVPADAVTVFHFSNSALMNAALSSPRAAIPLLPGGKFRDFLSAVGRSGSLSSSDGPQIIVSYHYVGGLEPLFVMDAGKGGDPASVVESLAKEAGLFCKSLVCSSGAVGGTYLDGRRVVLVSTSDVLVESSERHIAKGVSILDKEYFTDAIANMHQHQASVYVSNENAGKLVDTILNREFRSSGDSTRKLADWSAFSIDCSDGSLRMEGMTFSGSGANKFMNVFSSLSPASLTAFPMVPSYAVSMFDLPIADVAATADAYRQYYEAQFGRAKYTGEQTRLASEAGIQPLTWAKTLNIKEVCVTSFYTGDGYESTLLVKAGSPGAIATVFGAQDATPAVSDYPYAGFTKLLFGSLFSLKDETKYTILDGWVVVGSRKAVEEYTSGRALENTLAAYMEGAGLQPDLKNKHFAGYLSFSEDERAVDRIFRSKYAASVKGAFKGVVYVPALFTVSAVKGQRKLALSVDRVDVVRVNAPEIERDTFVEVPAGPFSVMNSGTGKMNSFYQQKNLYLCLEDETGKGLWGAPFQTPICGRAVTVDYFANGKLQILFAAGSKLYLIDRLGRFVSPFPVDLGKEVLLGPDVYDFSGRKKYNVMVLHKDNTVDMYNLQGKKPAEWKGISSTETIKNLPERIRVDGKSYWVVRTSLQTLIYPFYGGEPSFTLKGNDKLRPDSRITPVAGGVLATNYAGKEVTITLQ